MISRQSRSCGRLGDNDVVARRFCAFAELRAALVVSTERRRDRVSEPCHAGLRLSADDLPVRLSATTS
jgi:hypothetical protein